MNDHITRAEFAAYQTRVRQALALMMSEYKCSESLAQGVTWTKANKMTDRRWMQVEKILDGTADIPDPDTFRQTRYREADREEEIDGPDGDSEQVGVRGRDYAARLGGGIAALRPEVPVREEPDDEEDEQLAHDPDPEDGDLPDDAGEGFDYSRGGFGLRG